MSIFFSKITDRVFSVHETTDQVYQEVAKPLVDSAIKGYNGTIFAYGQTSSGKTFTMMGNKDSVGVLPLAIQDIFKTISVTSNMEFLLRVSYMEIYNETVTDLLCDSLKRKPLEIREGTNRNVYVADLTEEVVVSAKQVLEWIKKGEKNRHYGETKMNQRSSRSHTIFRMILESREKCDTPGAELQDMAVMVSHLNLVDLAGSERASQTGAEGLRLKEGCNINRSLFTLGQVIKKLTDGNPGGFTNYRDSKLTRILQNSLGGNAKTVIICTITPATIEETLSTLQFASTAKHMKNDPHVNEVLDDGALMRRYRNEIVDLKRRLEEVSSETRVQATEKEVLAQLLQEKDQLQREQEDRIKNLTMILVTSSSFVVNDMKEVIQAERNILKEEFDRLRKANEVLEQEKKRLQNEIAEKEELSEFKTFEEESNKLYETELMSEISSLKKEIESAGMCIENLKAELEMKSNELQKKEDWISEMQNLGGKDLMVEIQQLKHSLGDAETVNLDTKKEWAFLRSENLALKEKDVEITAKYQQMETDVQRLQSQLESEKKRFKTMQVDLQKELQIAFEENTKLTTLLDGKVPKNLIERFELEQKVAGLQKQLEKSLEGERTLHAEIEALSELKHLPEKVDDLMKKICEISNELCAIQSERDALLSTKAEIDVEIRELTEAKLQAAANLIEVLSKLEKTEQKMTDLSQQHDSAQKQCLAMSEECEKLKAELENVSADKEQLLNRLEDLSLQINELTAELKVVNSERDALLSERRDSAQSPDAELQELRTRITLLTEQRDQLQEILEGVRAEKNQLKADLEENVEMMIETQEELRVAQEKIGEQQQTVQDLNTQVAQREPLTENSSIEELPNTIDLLNKVLEELKLVTSERDVLLSDRRDSIQSPDTNLQKLQTHITSLTEERDQLQEILEGVRAEKNQLKADLEENVEMINELTAELKVVNSERDVLLSERRDSAQSPDAELQELHTRITSLTEERDQLQEILEGVRAEKNQLKADLEDNVEMVTELSEELKLVTSERDALLSESRDLCNVKEELKLQEQLVVELKDQSTEREAQLEHQVSCGSAVETQSDLRCAQEELKKHQQLMSDLKIQKTEQEAHLEQKVVFAPSLQVTVLTEELKVVTSERDSLLSESRDSVQSQDTELQELRTHIASLTQETDQLKEILEAVRAEKNHLRMDLEENVEMVRGWVLRKLKPI
ncbi:CENPE protein, partial [Amia calva]|nr:CENPE protein [Amia calva]